MGYTFREGKKDDLAIRTDTLTPVSDKEKIAALRRDGKIEMRTPVTFFVYDERYFELFYQKHCLGKSTENREFTLVVDKRGSPLSTKDAEGKIRKQASSQNPAKASSSSVTSNGLLFHNSQR